jgi:hypothetical protein
VVIIIYLLVYGYNYDNYNHNLRIGFLILNLNFHNMAYERKTQISDRHQKVLTAIGKKIFDLRKSTGLSIERFCVKNDLPRISYSNLEAGKNFHMTTLLKVLDSYPEIKTLGDFFMGI